MAADNSIWDEERIADELLLKLRAAGVSSYAVGKYLSRAFQSAVNAGSEAGLGNLRPESRKGCRGLRLLVVVTAHSTADWTLQQFREALPEPTLIDASFMTAIESSRKKWTRLRRSA